MMAMKLQSVVTMCDIKLKLHFMNWGIDLKMWSKEFMKQKISFTREEQQDVLWNGWELGIQSLKRLGKMNFLTLTWEKNILTISMNLFQWVLNMRTQTQQYYGKMKILHNLSMEFCHYIRKVVSYGKDNCIRNLLW